MCRRGAVMRTASTGAAPAVTAGPLRTARGIGADGVPCPQAQPGGVIAAVLQPVLGAEWSGAP